MNRLIELLKAFLAILIVTLVLSVATGVFYRYALHRSLFWATEVPNFLFVWIVFLGAVVAYHEKKHIAFTALLDRMAPQSRVKSEIAIHLLILCFAIFLIVTGIMVVRQTLSSPSEALKMPLGYLYSVLPFAFSVVSVDCIASIRSLLQNQSGEETQR